MKKILQKLRLKLHKWLWIEEAELRIDGIEDRLELLETKPSRGSSVELKDNPHYDLNQSGSVVVSEPKLVTIARAKNEQMPKL